MLNIIFFLSVLISFINATEKPDMGHFITYDGLKIRTAHWQDQSSTSKGTIILLQGMGSYIEGDQEFAQLLAQQGYNVLTFDWRGQGASQRTTRHSTLLDIDNFQAYERDLETFIKHSKFVKGPLILMGNSMGGHLAIRYAHNYPNQIDGIVTLAPMVEIKTAPYPYYAAKAIADIYVALGWGEKFVFGYNSFSYDKCVANYNPEKYGDIKRYLKDCKNFNENPNLAVGGPSFNWLKAAFKSCEEISKPEFARRINIPTLMIAVPNDHLVNPAAQRAVCENMPKCHFKIYKNAHHNLLRETDEIMFKFFEDLEIFRQNLTETLNTRNTNTQVAFNDLN